MKTKWLQQNSNLKVKHIYGFSGSSDIKHDGKWSNQNPHAMPLMRLTCFFPTSLWAYLERSLLPGVALATMLVKPILYLTGRVVSCMWLSCSSVNPDRNRHFPEMKRFPRQSSFCLTKEWMVWCSYIWWGRVRVRVRLTQTPQQPHLLKPSV